MYGKKMTSKQLAYHGWFSALAGGFFIGTGITLIVTVRWTLEGITAKNPSVQIIPEAYANVHLLGAISIILGILFSIWGIVEINRSQRTAIVQPLVSMEKKFCRYCGTENNKDAVFCEKCGKKISET
jgi:ribosomal protein L40E